jgi:hypothetical protein
MGKAGLSAGIEGTGCVVSWANPLETFDGPGNDCPQFGSRYGQYGSKE